MVGNEPSGENHQNRSDESEGEKIDVWERWTDENEVPFHRYCVLVPEGLPPIPGLSSRPPESKQPPLSYCPPLVRWALRHTSFIVLVATVAYVLLNFGATIFGIVSGFTFSLSILSAGAALVLAIWTFILARLVRRVLSVSGVGGLRIVVVYGLTVGLTAGLVLSMYATASESSFLLTTRVKEVLMSFPFNFLWMLMLGGHFVYDGMLRTENMFTRLGKKRPPIIENGAAYEEFVDSLQDRLNDEWKIPSWLRPVSKIPERIQTAYLFAGLYVMPFLIVWLLYSEKGGSILGTLAGVLGPLVTIFLNFFLVVVFFQFLVLVSYFNKLLTDHAPERADEASFTLRYEPNHHDGYAGFRDFGKFSTRVNLLLVIGGVYVASRFYVQGRRTFPGFESQVTLDLFFWGFNNLVPIATYVVAVVVWLYLSFWQIHKVMRRGRERELERCMREGTEPDPELKNGPVWPVGNNLLVSILSIDLVTAFLPLLPFVPG